MATHDSPAEKERRRRARIDLGKQLAFCLGGPLCFPLVCIYICWRGAYHVYKGTPKYKEKQREKKELQETTPPKPVQRKRALSVSGQPDRGTSTNQQLQSRLCALPAELRLQIYEQIIGRRDWIHVEFVYGHLEAYRCLKSDSLTASENHFTCWLQHFKKSDQKSSTSELDASKLGVSGLLKSCRLIYTECVNHLYSQPTFSLLDWKAFTVFMGCMLPARFECIQSVCVHRTQSLRYDYTYRALHDNDIRICNSVLPTLPHGLDAPLEGREWMQTEQILKKMPALQEVTSFFFLVPMIPSSGNYVPYKGPPLHMEESQSMFESFWAARKAEQWEKFEIISDEYSQSYCSVKQLRKKRASHGTS